jgi:hypothetical protein
MTYLTLFIGRTGRPPLAEGSSMFPLNTQWRYGASVLRLQDFAKPYHVLSKGFHVSDYKRCCPACPLHSHCVRTDRDCRQRQRGLQQLLFFDEFSDPARWIPAPSTVWETEKAFTVRASGTPPAALPLDAHTHEEVASRRLNSLTSLPCTTGLLSPRNIESTVRIWKALT